MKRKRTKLVLEKVNKIEQKLLRRIDLLQRNLLDIRSLQIKLSNPKDDSKPASAEA